MSYTCARCTTSLTVSINVIWKFSAPGICNATRPSPGRYFLVPAPRAPERPFQPWAALAIGSCKGRWGGGGPAPGLYCAELAVQGRAALLCVERRSVDGAPLRRRLRRCISPTSSAAGAVTRESAVFMKSGDSRNHMVEGERKKTQYRVEQMSIVSCRTNEHQ